MIINKIRTIGGLLCLIIILIFCSSSNDKSKRILNGDSLTDTIHSSVIDSFDHLRISMFDFLDTVRDVTELLEKNCNSIIDSTFKVEKVILTMNTLDILSDSQQSLFDSFSTSLFGKELRKSFYHAFDDCDFIIKLMDKYEYSTSSAMKEISFKGIKVIYDPPIAGRQGSVYIIDFR